MKHSLLALLFAAWAAAVPPQIAGTWEGKTNDLLSVELVVRQDRAGVSGTVGFYFQTRGEDGKWRLGPKSGGPFLSPKLEGRTLTFEILHHKKHGSPELGPNNKYRVDFVSPTEARLHQVNETPRADDAGLKLVRKN